MEENDLQLSKLTSSSTSDDVTSKKSPESRSTTSEPSWRVVVQSATLVCSEKCKPGWQDLFLTHVSNPDEWESTLANCQNCQRDTEKKNKRKRKTKEKKTLCSDHNVMMLLRRVRDLSSHTHWLYANLL